MSDQPTLTLTVGEDTYDLMPIWEALRFAHDYALSEDFRNALKNASTEVKHSPLVLLLESGLAVFEEIHDRHAEKSDDSPADA